MHIDIPLNLDNFSPTLYSYPIFRSTQHLYYSLLPYHPTTLLPYHPTTLPPSYPPTLPPSYPTTLPPYHPTTLPPSYPTTLLPYHPPPSLMQITSPHIPLAVYREFAAHLQQIEGIKVTFLTPIDRSFSYTESQLGGIEIFGADLLPDRDRLRLNQIVEYYLNRAVGAAT